MLWEASLDNGPDGGVAAQFLDSSDGFTLDQATSRVMTVQTSFLTSTTKCDSEGIANAADAAASAAGVTISDYCLHVYLLPQTTGLCNFAGLGYVGCRCGGCRVWTLYGLPSNPGAHANIITHEIGHNLGE
jgi:hypothetical protein